MFSREDREALYEIQLISGRSLENTKDIFVGLTTWIAYRYLMGEEINIPLLGKIQIKHKGDRLKEKGNEAIVDMDIEPSPFLVRTIGQLEDGEKTDIEKQFEKKIQLALKNKSEG